MNRLKLNIIALMTIASVIAIGTISNSDVLYAQSKVVSLEEAIKIAIDNNKQAKLAGLELQKAKSSVSEAYGNAYPNVNISGSITHFLALPQVPFPDFGALLNNSTYGILVDENIISEDQAKFMDMGTVLQSFAQSNNFETKAEVSQILFNSTVFRGIGASKIYEDISEESIKSTISKTVMEVKKAFFTVLFLKEVTEITSESFANAESNLASVNRMQIEGLVSEFDALQAEVQVENLRPMLINSENNLKMAFDGLKLAMGLDPREDIEIEGTLNEVIDPIPDSEKMIGSALINNYDITTLNKKKEVDEAMIDLYTSEYWPSVVAFGSYSYNGTSNDFNFLTYDQALVGLSFSINVFNGGQTTHRVEKAQVDYMKTNEMLSQLKDAIALQIRAKQREISNISSQIAAQVSNIKRAQKAYDISSIRYKEGTGTQLEILNADMALRQAKTNKLNSVYNLKLAFSELENLLGEVNPDYFKNYLK